MNATVYLMDGHSVSLEGAHWDYLTSGRTVVSQTPSYHGWQRGKDDSHQRVVVPLHAILYVAEEKDAHDGR